MTSTVAAARLLLPETFSEHALFSTITGLSYSGDVRMGVGEDPKKVENIVNGNLDAFRALYQPFLSASPKLEKTEKGYFQSSMSESRAFLISELPDSVSKGLSNIRENDYDVQRSMLKENISQIVRRSSFKMAVKGVITAGAIKTFRYLNAKVHKRLGLLINT